MRRGVGHTGPLSSPLLSLSGAGQGDGGGSGALGPRFENAAFATFGEGHGGDFSPDGMKFTTGIGNSIEEFDLQAPLDLSGAVMSGRRKFVSSPMDFRWCNGGMTALICWRSGGTMLSEFRNCTEAYNVATMSTQDTGGDFQASSTSWGSGDCSPDGTLVTIPLNSQRLGTYSLPTPFVLSGETELVSFSAGRAIRYNADGTIAYVVFAISSDANVTAFSCPTPYSLAGAVEVGRLAPFNYLTSRSYSLSISPDFNTLFFSDGQSNTIQTLRLQ